MEPSGGRRQPTCDAERHGAPDETRPARRPVSTYELWQSVSLQGTFESTTAPVWLLSLWMIVLGTIIPFALSLGALHHLPATRVSIVAMVEVVLASIVAWVWLEETLSAAQLAGGAIVLTGIVLAQTSR